MRSTRCWPNPPCEVSTWRGRSRPERVTFHGEQNDGPLIAAIDTGIKLSIVRSLVERGARLELHPCTATPDELLASSPDAVFLANGPGDPAALDYVVETVRAVIGRQPTFGICLGHQLLCRAVGLETFKLQFGHRGANHPVKDLRTGRIEITSQNHGFAVAAPDGGLRVERDEPVRWETEVGAAELSHVNLYDRTVEGLDAARHPRRDGPVPPRGRAGTQRLAVPLRPLPRPGEGPRLMPRRDDLHKILIVGSGPIVIGQAAEFDYSGVQACKVLREEGYEVDPRQLEPGDDHDRPGVR